MTDYGERLWSKVHTTGGCWYWLAAKCPLGYGRFGTHGKSVGTAHRVVYEALVGPIEKGLVLDHLCRNPGCVNPDHLEPVTQGENVRRGRTSAVQKQRYAHLTHCVSGRHPLSGENLYIDSDGCRVCKQCKRDSAARIRERKNQ